MYSVQSGMTSRGYDWDLVLAIKARVTFVAKMLKGAILVLNSYHIFFYLFFSQTVTLLHFRYLAFAPRGETEK